MLRHLALERNRDLQPLLDAMPDGVLIVDGDGRIIFVNTQLTMLFGYAERELLGQTVDLLLPEPARARHAEHRGEFVADPATRPMGGGRDLRARRRDGTEFAVDVSLSAVDTERGTAVVAAVRDVTERSRLMTQLADAQKMEAIGRLAGGIAHDFNNLLTVILGDCEYLLDTIDAADPAHARLEEICHAGARAAELTRQLLGFSRRQTIAPRVLSLNTELESLRQMVQRLVGEDVAVTLLPDPALWPARLDPSQVAQVVVNLAANARDAMPRGGTLAFATHNVTLRDDDGTRLGVPPGDYVELSVTDTGTGMDPATLSHVFEPFFTTKPQGHGTGLGMATIYGIVTQNSGAIDIDSKVGGGTTVRLLFPSHRGEPIAVPASRPVAAPSGGSEVILLVEDDARLRRLTRGLLQRLGYTVVEAADPDAACVVCDGYSGTIDLLVTDIVMPSMNGVDLAARISARRPGIRVLFVSGYASDVIAERSALPGDTHYLPKPYDLAGLASAVRRALESKR